MLDGVRFLSADQFLLTTLIVKLAVMAVLATMLARYHRFRHILIFERRDWHDRLVFVLFFGVPLAFGGGKAIAAELFGLAGQSALFVLGAGVVLMVVALISGAVHRR